MARIFDVARLVALALAVCVLSVAAAHAEKRLALVIGIDDYQEVPKLQKAVGDANAVGDKLASIGFQVSRALNPDRRALALALANFYSSIEPGDTVLIHYSGHGVEIKRENYLLPKDIPNPDNGSPELLTSEAIPLASLVDTLQDKGANVRILIIDACRDNPFAASGKRALGTARGLAAVSPPKGSFIMYSAGTGQAALDRLNDGDKSNTSVFTRVLLTQFDKKGLLLRDMASGVRTEVNRLAKSVGHEQFPAYYDEMTTDFAFLPGDSSNPNPEPAPAPSPAPDPDAEARLAWDSVKNLGSVAALEIVGKRYPNSVYGQLAMERARELRNKTSPEPRPVPKPKPKPAPAPDPDPTPDPAPEPAAKLRWVVILGTFSKDQKSKAQARLNDARNFGFDALIIDTDDYSGLADGFYSVVVNAGTRGQALNMLPHAKEFRGEAYVKLSQ